MITSLGATAKLKHDHQHHGLFMTMTRNDQEERFLHVLNPDEFDKHVRLEYKGKELFDGTELIIQSKDSLMLPLDMEIDGRIHTFLDVRFY